MKEKQSVFYAFVLSSAIHIAGIGALGGFFDLPIEQIIPETRIVEIVEKKTPLLPEIKVLGEIPNIVSQQKKQEKVTEHNDDTLKVVTKELSEVRAEDIKAEQAMLRYQDMIKQRIETFRKYPLRARRNQTQGVVDLEFRILASGAAKAVKIIKSSGSTLLDQEALNTIQIASPFLPLPKEISQNIVKIHVAIVFSLN